MDLPKLGHPTRFSAVVLQHFAAGFDFVFQFGSAATCSGPRRLLCCEGSGYTQGGYIFCSPLIALVLMPCPAAALHQLHFLGIIGLSCFWGSLDTAPPVQPMQVAGWGAGLCLALVVGVRAPTTSCAGPHRFLGNRQPHRATVGHVHPITRLCERRIGRGAHAGTRRPRLPIQKMMCHYMRRLTGGETLHKTGDTLPQWGTVHSKDNLAIGNIQLGPHE